MDEGINIDPYTVDWKEAKINYLVAKGRAFPQKQNVEPQVDVEVSRIVGRKVFVNDRKLIDWSVKKVRERDPSNLDPRPLLDSKQNKEELRKLFG